MSSPKSSVDTSSTPEGYLDDVRYRVTRYFCSMCLVMAILSIPSSFLAKDRTTLLINFIGLFFYIIPLVISVKTLHYKCAARVLLVIAMIATVANAVAANFDISLPTTVWYFGYLVFAHLVLGLSWAVVVAGIALVSVSGFAAIHLLDIHRINPLLNENSIIVGSPVALAVSLAALLYLLTVYRNLRDGMLRRVLAANREKSQLVGIMSHDMRNYLGAIQGICSILQYDVDRCPDEVMQKEFTGNLSLVNQASTGALQLVEEVVAAARDSSDQKLFMEEVDLREFILPIFGRYQVLARTKGVQFTMEAGGVPVRVSVNRDRFSRVIENLLSNALKFTNANNDVTISVGRKDGAAFVSVADTGIGIPADLLGVLFDPFTKAGRSGTANEKSIGLGLSIVKKLVEQHGGTIQCESEAGRGTTFVITLPVVHDRS